MSWSIKPIKQDGMTARIHERRSLRFGVVYEEMWIGDTGYRLLLDWKSAFSPDWLCFVLSVCKREGTPRTAECMLHLSSSSS